MGRFLSPGVSPIKSTHRENKNWSATFPDKMDTLEDSKLLMSRCLYVGFAHILESRRLLPPTMFKKRSIDGMVRTYVMNLNEAIGIRVASKFRGAGEAIHKGYLREFMIVVSCNENDEDDAIEVYTWRMRYGNDGVPSAEFIDGDGNRLAALRYMGPEHVKRQTRALLLMIRKLCRNILAPLPSNAFASFRITYTPSTPRGYQAPGFYRSPTLYNISPEAQEVEIGKVQTDYHGLIVNVKSVFIDDSYTMEMRMKESSSANTSHDEPLNDSLNDSFGDDRGENDQHNTSVESTELSPPQRSDNIEEPVNTSTTGIHGNQNDEVDEAEMPRGDQGSDRSTDSIRKSRRVRKSAAKESISDHTSGADDSSLMAARGSAVSVDGLVTVTESSLSPEDAPQKRGRGKKATAVTQKKSPAFVRGVQKVHKSPHRAKSTHITPPRLRATPGRASKGVTPGSSPPLPMRK